MPVPHTKEGEAYRENIQSKLLDVGKTGRIDLVLVLNSISEMSDWLWDIDGRVARLSEESPR